MRNFERINEQENEPTRGQVYLEMLDLGHFAHYPVETANYGTIQAHQFMDICGDQAGPQLEKLRLMDKNHPQYEQFKHMFQKSVMNQIGIVEPEA